MRCERCSGYVYYEEMEYGEGYTARCLNCGMRKYPPLPSTPTREVCYYCRTEAPTPGKVSCAECDEKGKLYRKAHPRKKCGPKLPIIQEVQ